jgi:aldehyde dehydrogenase (NAD+)
MGVQFKPEERMLIDGQLVPASSGKKFDNLNPATEEVLGQVADAGKEDMQRAIAAARRAFDETDWSTNRDLRKRCLLQLQEALEVEREELRAELVAEVGAPLSTTYAAQLDLPLADAIRWPVKMMDQFPWERTLEESSAFGVQSRRMVWKEAIGVVADIVPWNYPFEVSSNKLAQTLVAGNTAVLKPAPDTPWNATRIGRLAAENTDMPPGVLNVVTTSDNMIAEELLIDPRVDMVSFTGSTAVGKRIMEKGAATLKRVFLELGGKSAHIVLDDADFETTLPYASGMCMHAGQGCVLLTRLLVPRARYDEAVELVANAFREVTYGDPAEPKNIMGPVISARQRDRIMGYIEKGVEEGARLVVGGHRPAHLSKGYYIEPTVFADVVNSMTIAREEIFGPVLCVLAYDDEDDAVRIANESDYGLGAAVTSADEERALAVARRLRAGALTVNGGVWYGADSPYGGYKTSGVGRQGGIEGFEQYLETKAVAVGSVAQ